VCQDERRSTRSAQASSACTGTDPPLSLSPAGAPNNLIVGSTNLSPKSFEEAVRRRFEWVYLPAMTRPEREHRVLGVPRAGSTESGGSSVAQVGWFDFVDVYLHAALPLCEALQEALAQRLLHQAKELLEVMEERVEDDKGKNAESPFAVKAAVKMVVAVEEAKAAAAQAVAALRSFLRSGPSPGTGDAFQVFLQVRKWWDDAGGSTGVLEQAAGDGVRTLQAYTLLATEGMTQHTANQLVPEQWEKARRDPHRTTLQALHVAAEGKGTGDACVHKFGYLGGQASTQGHSAAYLVGVAVAVQRPNRS
jgi:hypothetical protein